MGAGEQDHPVRDAQMPADASQGALPTASPEGPERAAS